jgi:hypothetical protein
MSSKIEIVKAFIQYGVLPPDCLKSSRSRNTVDNLVDRAMLKINANLLMMNVPEFAESRSGYVDITPEVIYETLQEFDSPIEVVHLCKYVYVALVEDPKSCVNQLSGNKLGKNTIKVVEYASTKSSRLPHERINMFFPKEQIEESGEESQNPDSDDVDDVDDVEDQNMMIVRGTNKPPLGLFLVPLLLLVFALVCNTN